MDTEKKQSIPKKYNAFQACNLFKVTERNSAVILKKFKDSILNEGQWKKTLEKEKLI